MTAGPTGRTLNAGTLRGQLLIRPRRKEVESLGGFALRLAHENGLSNPLWLANGFTEESVASRGLGRARWCSMCLSQNDGFWSADWAIGPAICIEHKAWLEDKCAQCGRPGGWRSLRFLSCRCDADLRQTEPKYWSAEIHALLCSSPDIPQADWGSLTLTQRWSLAVFLGALDQHGLNGKPLKRSSARAVAAERRYLTAGALLMAAPPYAIVDLLSRLRCEAPANAGPQLIGEALPGLLVMLRKGLGAAEREYLMSHVRAFLSTTLEGKAPVVWQPKAAESNVGAKAAGRSLRVRPARIRELAVTFGVDAVGRATPSGRTMLVVGPATVEHIRAAMANTLSSTAAANRFGLSRSRLWELVRGGLIARVGHGIDASSVASLIRRITSGASREGTLQSTERVTVAEALRLFVPSAATIDFVRALLEGKMPVRFSGGSVTSFRDLRVDRREAKSIVWLIAKRSGNKLSVPNVARTLGVKEEVAYHLVRRGLIRSSPMRAGRREARFVEQVEIDRFQAEIQPLARVAAKAGISGRSSLQWSIDSGLELVSGPTVDAGRQYFVRMPLDRR